MRNFLWYFRAQWALIRELAQTQDDLAATREELKQSQIRLAELNEAFRIQVQTEVGRRLELKNFDAEKLVQIRRGVERACQEMDVVLNLARHL